MPDNLLGLDVGQKRTGVALALAPVYIAQPLITLDTGDLQSGIDAIIKDNNVKKVVVGYPRNQAGEATEQTKLIERVIENLDLGEAELVWQDESLTSVKAEAELEKRGEFAKADVDSLAATFILEDYVKERHG